MRNAITILLCAIIVTAAVSVVAAGDPCPPDRDGVCVSLASPEYKKDDSGARSFLAQLPFPGLEFLGVTTKSQIDEILTATYRFGISVVALAAFGMLVFGGVVYLTAGDNSSRVGYARSLISNAIFGLLLALLSFLLLYIINPDLVFTLNLNRLGSSTTPTSSQQIINNLSSSLQQQLGLTSAQANNMAITLSQQFGTMTPPQINAALVNLGLSPQPAQTITAEYSASTIQSTSGQTSFQFATPSPSPGQPGFPAPAPPPPFPQNGTQGVSNVQTGNNTAQQIPPPPPPPPFPGT
jgi:hypothetical protein